MFSPIPCKIVYQIWYCALTSDTLFKVRTFIRLIFVREKKFNKKCEWTGSFEIVSALEYM